MKVINKMSKSRTTNTAKEATFDGLDMEVYQIKKSNKSSFPIQ